MNPKGCDLSHFNAVDSFHDIVAAGCSFVYLKATQGVGFIDDTFDDRYGRARSVNLRVGAYHFFDPNADGDAQAEHFLSVFGKMLPDDLPPALDIESTPGWGETATSNQIQAVGKFLQHVYAALGVMPLIYCSMGWWKGVFGNADFSGHPLWLAHYADEPGDTGLWSDYTVWQYGDKGTVPGAGDAGTVDTDQWNGDLPA